MKLNASTEPNSLDFWIALYQIITSPRYSFKYQQMPKRTTNIILDFELADMVLSVPILPNLPILFTNMICQILPISYTIYRLSADTKYRIWIQGTRLTYWKEFIPTYLFCEVMSLEGTNLLCHYVCHYVALILRKSCIYVGYASDSWRLPYLTG